MTKITYREVEGFIRERCADFRCPACGGTQLEPAAEGDGQPIALLYENSPAKSWFGPPGYLRVFALNCASCSYVLIFRLDALERLIRARSGRVAAHRPLPGNTGSTEGGTLRAPESAAMPDARRTAPS